MVEFCVGLAMPAKSIQSLAIILASLGLLTLIGPRLLTAAYAISRMYALESAPDHQVAIIFGAGLRRDGTPTAVLRDRVATAADLYLAGKVQKLLLSGDNRFENYNEPAAMRQYAIQLGVPADDIVLDYAGRRTYDTCYRARAIFGVEKALLVTQPFHLPRAIYICNQLGIISEGVRADRNRYRVSTRMIWNIRELLATSVALWDIHITRPIPVLGDPEPIFSKEIK